MFVGKEKFDDTEGVIGARFLAKDAATAKKNLTLDGKVVGETDGQDLGIDRQPYRVVELSTAVNGLNAGRYLKPFSSAHLGFCCMRGAYSLTSIL